METLVVVSQHKNHQYGYNNRSRNQFHGRFNSSPGKFNCRFQATAGGVLPGPFSPCKSVPPVTILRRPLVSTNRQEETSPKGSFENNLKNSGKAPGETSVKGSLKNNVKTSIVGVNWEKIEKEKFCEDDLCYSELWAGPAYSNSPPPSSLPIPKFSLRQKRSVSLELPVMERGVKIHALAKSAPCSPKRDMCSSPNNCFISAEFATKDLRRILHLDVADE